MKRLLLIDFETRSRADLSSVGQYVYACHPSTQILCIGWKFIGDAITNIVPFKNIYNGKDSYFFEQAVKQADYLVAHNAAFERNIWNETLVKTPFGKRLPKIPPEKWVCTLAMASILSLPRSLEAVGEVLGLDIKKDKEGRKLLLKLCKPTPFKNDLSQWKEWIEDDESLDRLYEYCATDIKAEESLFIKLNSLHPFTTFERGIYVLDQKINERGLRIDRELCERALYIINDEEERLTIELRRETYYQVGTAKQTAAIIYFLGTQGVYLLNLQKATVASKIEELEKLDDPYFDTALKVLKIRKALGKSSTSKYTAFLDRAGKDDRVRDNLLYHGASTGRWSGSGVQPQNFPRGIIKVTKDTVNDIKTIAPDILSMLYCPPMDLLSSALRSVIVADEGMELLDADFSSIEARVLLWLAGDVSGLKEYEAGLDTYKTMAATIYGLKSIEEVTEAQRQVGKTVILACGYQMGLKKFSETAKNNGLDLPESLIERAHAAFKEKYPRVPLLWKSYEAAAISAVLSPGKSFHIGRVTWYVEKDFLWAKLPSGRRLAYYKPYVKNEPTPFGDVRPKLYHGAVNSVSKKWEWDSSQYGGKLTENISQAVSRDVMAESMVRCEAHGFITLLTVHDELLNSAVPGRLEEFKALMAERPSWALDLPLKVSGWAGDRYRK